MSATWQAERELDVRGEACPLPVIKIRKVLDTLASGERLRVISSDKGAASDFHALIKATGAELVAQEASGNTLHFLIRKT